MSITPTDKPSSQDPWAVPGQASKAAASKAAATTATSGLPRQPKQTSAQQVARLERAKAAQAKMADRMTWPLAVRLMLASAACRVVMAGILICYGLEDAHLRSLLVAPSTTADQWLAAWHTANTLHDLYLPFVVALGLPFSLWVRVRAYVAKLPGVAPHQLQSRNAQYRALNVPAFWPPVPQGTDSWTRRVHWRVPPGISAVLLVLLLVTNVINRWVLTMPSDRYELSSVVDLVAAGLALICSAFDLIRLRGYSRWPGRV